MTVVYDGDGNRVSETVAGVTTKYLVDTVNPTGYAQVVDELQSGTVTKTYAYGLERIDQNWQPSAGTWQAAFYGYDGHGSVRQLTNAAGTITDTYDYDAFGNLINSTGSTPNVYLFAGEAYDAALGLYYNRARYLNTATGRFWNMDTFEGTIFEPKSLHKYTFVSANPVNGVDPNGHEEGTLEGQEISMAVVVTLALATTLLTLGYVCVAYANTTGGGPCGSGPSQEYGSMRIQLQLSSMFTVPGTPALQNVDPPGVTALQVRQGLQLIYAIAQTQAAKFPFNSLESDLVTAVIIVSQQAGTFAPLGYTGAKKSLLSAPIGDSGWRIDVDNLYGTNLRQ